MRLHDSRAGFTIGLIISTLCCFPVLTSCNKKSSNPMATPDGNNAGQSELASVEISLPTNLPSVPGEIWWARLEAEHIAKKSTTITTVKAGTKNKFDTKLPVGNTNFTLAMDHFTTDTKEAAATSSLAVEATFSSSNCVHLPNKTTQDIKAQPATNKVTIVICNKIGQDTLGTAENDATIDPVIFYHHKIMLSDRTPDEAFIVKVPDGQPSPTLCGQGPTTTRLSVRANFFAYGATDSPSIADRLFTKDPNGLEFIVDPTMSSQNPAAYVALVNDIASRDRSVLNHLNTKVPDFAASPLCYASVISSAQNPTSAAVILHPETASATKPAHSMLLMASSASFCTPYQDASATRGLNTEAEVAKSSIIKFLNIDPGAGPQPTITLGELSSTYYVSQPGVDQWVRTIVHQYIVKDSSGQVIGTPWVGTYNPENDELLSPSKITMANKLLVSCNLD